MGLQNVRKFVSPRRHRHGKNGKFASEVLAPLVTDGGLLHNALMADAEGRSADALSFMQAAAYLEKSIDTHDTLSPGPVGATAHESLGELLLKTGKPREALASFEESLKLAKHRARSYLGAAKSASLAGDADRHKAHVAKLAEVCGIAAATTSVQDRNDVELRTLPCAWLAR